MVFYVSGHTAVLYDCWTNKQSLLQGHVRLRKLIRLRSFTSARLTYSQSATQLSPLLLVEIDGGSLHRMWVKTPLSSFGILTRGKFDRETTLCTSHTGCCYRGSRVIKPLHLLFVTHTLTRTHTHIHHIYTHLRTHTHIQSHIYIHTHTHTNTHT